MLIPSKVVTRPLLTPRTELWNWRPALAPNQLARCDEVQHGVCRRVVADRAGEAAQEREEVRVDLLRACPGDLFGRGGEGRPEGILLRFVRDESGLRDHLGRDGVLARGDLDDGRLVGLGLDRCGGDLVAQPPN
jgi:hypothetical protein